ncbi:MAG TPA: PAS domain S-box protein [Methanoregulaceae archaeon]|nr:PAS domain S-box protein [Methanoregulaceae archaeon]
MMQEYQQELNAIEEILKKNSGGMSVTDISKALKKNKNTIGRYLDILLISGRVDMRTYGKAKVFTISQRVPLSAMLSYSKELIMVLDNESRITDINDNFLKLLQLSRDEAVGKNIGFLESPEVDVHEFLETITAGIGEGEVTVSFHMMGDGERIFHQKCVPTVFEDGRKGITLILDDITDRILNEREIRTSEERFRMMADNIQDGLVITNKGKTIYANGRIAEITGYAIEEIMAGDPLMMVAPECREKAEQQIRELETNPDKPITLPLWIIRKDQDRRFVFVRVSGVRHQDSEYNFVVFTDVTELKVQEERLRMMADNIQDGIILVENEKIVFTNRRIEEISGYSMEEMAAMGLWDTLFKVDKKALSDSGFIQIKDMEEINKIIRNVRPNSSPKEYKIWIKRKDGIPRYILGKVTAARHGSISSIYITISDITEFAERERNLRERINALQDLLH